MSSSIERLYETSIRLHAAYRGKLMVMPKVPIKTIKDLAIWSTPGVAGPVLKILDDKDEVFELTWRWNTIAVVSDGSRVLGFGNVGPEASYPVMEGKALLFKYLGGVDAIPLPVRAESPDDLIYLLKLLEPAFGGFNLEDIASPKCFYVLEKAREALDIPVWHDDQQGTAAIVLAALINALKIVGKKLQDVIIALIGVGAANTCVARILIKAGARPGNLILVDSKGILHREREDLEGIRRENPWKYELALMTNAEGRRGGIPEALKGADVVIAMSRPGPGVIKKEWIKLMNKDPIVFACANPVPEILPHEAKEAGAKVVATGRGDWPNRVNNSLVFPGVFRGVLDVRARKITDEMLIAAAEEIARFVEEGGLSEDHIVPRMDEWDLYPRVAAAVAAKAVEQGVARRSLSYKEELKIAREIINESRSMFEHLMKGGFIRDLGELSR